jgi:2-(1,2-epoxy-1,2-dihydrophenyl)acetyl-CoA isomerase
VTDDALTLIVADGVAHATLSRPELGNAFDLALCDAILALATRCVEDDTIRCLLVTSTGKWFSTGGDLAELGQSREGAPAFVERATRSLHAGIALLARMDAPVVVAMRGGAIGVGVALPAAADFCLVTERVRFLAGYPAIGMTVDAGLSYYLPRRVGGSRRRGLLPAQPHLVGGRGRAPRPGHGARAGRGARRPGARPRP